MTINKSPYRIAHVIDGLAIGDGETLLYNLLSCVEGTAFESTVLSLTDIGAVGDKIRAAGVPVEALGMRRWSTNPLKIARLVGLLRQSSADVIQTWPPVRP